MKVSWKSIPLHHKILGGLVLGALFGALFNVSKYELNIRYADDGVEQTAMVASWDSIAFVGADTRELAAFGREDQQKILQFFRRLPADQKRSVILTVRGGTAGREIHFTNINALEKVKTLPVLIKPVGTLFVRLLMFVAIPMVFASLIVGASSLGDIRRVGRLGGFTMLWYMATTTIAIAIGIVLVDTIQPGLIISPEAREKLVSQFQGDVQTSVVPVDLLDTIMRIVPTNPLGAMAGGDMLGIIFFALMVGVSLTLISPDRARPVIQFFEGFSDLMITMVKMVMTIAPYGVFALIAATVGEFGFDILETLVWYALTLVLGLAIHAVVVLGGAVRLFAGIPVLKFFRAMRDPILLAFTTSSSAATLPVNMRACEENLGVPKSVTSFVLPLGATVNMDGTSMYQAVATLFIAQVYGFDLTFAQQMTILFTAVLASIGTAPVPGVGIIMLIIVLRSVNVPEEGIALILGIDRFLDMCRTVPNILGDAAVATIIAKREGVLEARP